MNRYHDRLARSLAQVVNLLDPDVIVLGGGMSRVKQLYEGLPGRMQSYVLGKEAGTDILPAYL